MSLEEFAKKNSRFSEPECSQFLLNVLCIEVSNAAEPVVDLSNYIIRSPQDQEALIDCAGTNEDVEMIIFHKDSKISSDTLNYSSKKYPSLTIECINTEARDNYDDGQDFFSSHENNFTLENWITTYSFIREALKNKHPLASCLIKTMAETLLSHYKNDEKKLNEEIRTMQGWEKKTTLENNPPTFITPHHQRSFSR